MKDFLVISRAENYYKIKADWINFKNKRVSASYPQILAWKLEIIISRNRHSDRNFNRTMAFKAAKAYSFVKYGRLQLWTI